MRVLVQRVAQARVTVDDTEVGAIGHGLLLFVGIAATDGESELQATTDKIANLRIFEDGEGRMNQSALDLKVQGEPVGTLVVSQFTLYGDVRKGRRPSFTEAAASDHAAPMIERFGASLADHGLAVATGVFGAPMMVSLINDGPVTIWIDSDDLGQSPPREISRRS